MTTIPFGPQLIGRTEKALNALLDRELAGTGLTEPQWVTLTLTVLAEGTLSPAALAVRVAEALRVAEPVAREHLVALAAAGLVVTTAGLTVAPTDRGLEVWRSVRAATSRITDSLWGDLPAPDRETAARVLNVVLTRAGAAL
ncbi:hypothetical protein Aab01nite_07840 [Paractinoplanes abujensis]|uniref:DNA-binding MarR family transcriptional regulator n=1 Tax=Paractinoplanes abujensis TaxID=882441 RepID=A0A7W7CMS5_9ACTN|nr:MarR family transcriptional regulator [Actinoplanes abujensis]MBB4691393.1 DNA-binding MarR family transcriptional regulator [Actinoplanes abujensis]GID17194.1 hypothetical protein Aab01nite_07840 [Actinoplanes abujensis]